MQTIPHLNPLELAKRRRNIRKEHLSLNQLHRIAATDPVGKLLTADNITREWGPRPVGSNFPTPQRLAEKGFRGKRTR